MVTRPLDLLSRVRKPTAGADWLYFVNAGLIALFFVLFGSRFVISPGIVVSGENGARSIVLPNVPHAVEMGAPTTFVIRVAGPDLIFTRDGKYTFPEIRQWLQRMGKSHPGERLLVQTDASALLGDFTEITSAAQDAGFVVILAAEPGVLRESGLGVNGSSAPLSR